MNALIIRKFFVLSLLLFSNFMCTQLLGEGLQPGKYYVNQIKEALESNNKENFTSLFADYLKAPQPCNPCLIKVLSAKPEWFSYALNNGLTVDIKEKLSTVFTDSTEAVQTLINKGHLVEDVWLLAVQSEQMADFLIKKGANVNGFFRYDSDGKVNLIICALYETKNNLYQILRKKGADIDVLKRRLKAEKDFFCDKGRNEFVDDCDKCSKRYSTFLDYESAFLKEEEQRLKKRVSFADKLANIW